MAYKTVFKRYEIKYMLTREQQDRILEAMEPYMTADEYGLSTIRNLYFDTDDYILARHSIAKPDFKEKLRIRSYSAADRDSTVFVELKRKFDKVVYKRRVAIPEHEAMAWTGARPAAETNKVSIKGISADPERMEPNTQVVSEIEYFLNYYKELHPVMFLSYDRQAYRMREDAADLNNGGSDFRVTFDENILARADDLSLCSEVYGTPLLEEGKVLMELKCSGGIPLWMTEVLSEEKLYKTSFSKYGTAYTRMIYPRVQWSRRRMHPENRIQTESRVQTESRTLAQAPAHPLSTTQTDSGSIRSHGHKKRIAALGEGLLSKLKISRNPAYDA